MGKTRLTRRQFVSTITAGAGTVLIGNSVLAGSAPAKGAVAGELKIVTLGNSGLKTTVLGMGTGFSSYDRPSVSTRAGIAVTLIRQAYEKGIRYFDCADSYGTHSTVESALRGFPRESYTLGTKIWGSQGNIPEPERPDADLVVERFRKELRTDYLDLVQIHCMTEALWTDRQKKQLDILEDLKAKNIVRAHGVSVHSIEAMAACIGNPWVDVIHVRINPYGEAMDHSDPNVVTSLISKLHNEGKGIIGMKLTGSGKFKNDGEKIDEALNFILGPGTVDMILVGFEQPEQIDNYISRVHNVLKTQV